MLRLWLVLLTFALTPAFAAAQPVDDQADSRAREIFVNGVELYEEGRYDLAIEAFQEAYRLSRRPDLLFNIANTFEKLDQLPEAIDALQRYRVYARPEERADITERIRGWERELASRRTGEPIVIEDEPADGLAEEPADEPTEEPADEPTEEPADPFGGRRDAPAPRSPAVNPAGPVLIGAGSLAAGAFGAVAGVTWGQARDARTLNDQAGWEAVRPLNNASLVALGVGAATALAGVAVSLVDATRRGGSVAAAPWATFDGQTAVVGVVIVGGAGR